MLGGGAKHDDRRRLRAPLTTPPRDLIGVLYWSIGSLYVINYIKNPHPRYYSISHFMYTPFLVATLIQGAFRSRHYQRFNLSRVPALQQRPQVKGIVSKITNMSPKKPNSAVRIVAKVNLTNGLRITGRMPGIGYLCGRYNRVLVTGGRANDLPGVGYTLIRGVFDFSPVIFKKRRRSVYGVSRPDGFTKYVKKSLRIIR